MARSNTSEPHHYSSKAHPLRRSNILGITTSTMCGLTLSAAVHAAPASPATHDSSRQAPVSAPETDAALSNSGELVPGQSIRPESRLESSVPKTPKDKEAASSADVGNEKSNVKSNRSSSASDTTNTLKVPATNP